MVRTADSLYRHIESCFAFCLCHIYGFQMIEKYFSCIPWHIFGSYSHVVTFCRTDRNDHYILKAKAFGKFIDIFDDLIESFFTVTHKIHLIDRKYKMMDSHQGTDTTVTSCLYQNALFCVDKDDRKLCKRSTNCHISCIFLVSRCICNNEASLVRCKITIGNINGDALFSLCHQTIQKERIVDRTASGSHLTVEDQSFFLVCIKQLGIVKYMSDQCGFSIVYTAAGNKFQ